MKIRNLLKVIVPLIILTSFFFGYIFAPNDPNLVDMSNRLADSCIKYPLGTDILGRCVYSRLLYGGRITIGIVVLGCLIVMVFGTVIGLTISGVNGKMEIILDGILNAVTAIPPIAYLIIFIGAWGNGIFTMIMAITISLFLRLIKLVKTRTEIELGRAYVMCAITSGASKRRVLCWHVIPNIINDIVRFICLSCADMILAVVSFSFIGLGLGDNIIDWGTMVSDSHQLILTHPRLTLYPVACIFMCTLSFYLLGKTASDGGKVNA